MYLDAAGQVIPDASTIGAGAAGVPGTVAGLWQLHRRFGALPWSADLAPALRYAHEGFRVERVLAEERDHFAVELHGAPTSSLTSARLASDATFRQSELESTLRRIAAAGPRGFYAGRTAELIAAEMARSHGHITRADLAAYRAVWREHSPASGPATASSPRRCRAPGALPCCRCWRLKGGPRRGVRGRGAQLAAVRAPCWPRSRSACFADRAAYFGDPDRHPTPVAQLLDPGYLARRAREVSTGPPTPTSEVEPGLAEHHNTTHFSIIDQWGNAVSSTYTLNDWFGSGTGRQRRGVFIEQRDGRFLREGRRAEHLWRRRR